MKSSDETYSKIRDMKFDGYIILLNIPLSDVELSNIIEFNVETGSKLAIKREAIGDANYTLNHGGSEIIYGLPKFIQSSLAQYRQLPSSYKWSLINVGIE